jgi:hypothetical protein
MGQSLYSLPHGRHLLRRRGARRTRAGGSPDHAARRRGDAGLHAGGHGGGGEVRPPPRPAGDRGPHPAREHLPPHAAAGRRARGHARGAALLHRLGRPLPHRQRRLPGLLARRPAKGRRRGRPLPEPPRRIHARPVARAGDCGPAEPRSRHRDGLRRVPAR